MEFVNMKMDAAQAAEYNGATPSPADAPAYPWGLQLCLDDESMKKLGMPLPEVGGNFTLMALVKVTRTSANQTEGGENKTSCDLQITDMQLTPADATADDVANKLWPSQPAMQGASLITGGMTTKL